LSRKLWWADILSDYDTARKGVGQQQLVALQEPVVDIAGIRFGIDLHNVRQLNRFMRGLGTQGVAMARSAGRIHRHVVFGIAPEAAQRLSSLISLTWHSFYLEIFSAELGPFLKQPWPIRASRSLMPAPHPRSLRWAALAPTQEQLSKFPALSLGEPDVAPTVAYLLSAHADGLFAFTSLAAARMIAETAVGLLQPADRVPQESAERWRDMVMLTNLSTLPGEWQILAWSKTEE
jgi:hypothetical protein